MDQHLKPIPGAGMDPEPTEHASGPTRLELVGAEPDARHTEHVTELAMAVGRRLGIRGEDLERLELAIVLHEVGAGPSGTDEVAEIVRGVHERWDGRGYPQGLKSSEIPLASRVVGACEAYDAMISDPKREEALSPLEACRELAACAGAQYDPVVVATLIGHLRRTRVLTIAEAA